MLMALLMAAGVWLPGDVRDSTLELNLGDTMRLTLAAEDIPAVAANCTVSLHTHWVGLMTVGKINAITQQAVLTCPAGQPPDAAFSIRARIDEPARLILPDNDNTRQLLPDTPVTFTWAVAPGKVHVWEGTLWTELLIANGQGESVMAPLASVHLNGRTTTLLGLGYIPALAAAGVILAAGVAALVSGLLHSRKNLRHING